MTDIRTAVVIGGGIAGPVTAIALQQAGIEATVYEAYDAGSDGVGGMLGLAPNGLDALAAVGLDHVVRGLAQPVSAMVIHSWTGKPLARFADPTGTPILHVIWRADLHRALYEEAGRRGIRIEHGHRVVRADDTGDGVSARFADGSVARADILIGADGVRSTVRSLIDPTAPAPRYTGLLGFGGWTTGADVAATNDDYHMIFGKNAFFGYQAARSGRTSWFANLPRREPLTLAQTRGTAADRWLDVLRDAFAADRTPAAAILGHTDPAHLTVVGALDIMPTAPVWSRDRIVLVGDAVHVPSPSSGQGASLAIEGAVELARCLRDLPTKQAFAAYENLRRERVTRIIALAARTNSHKAAGPVGRRLRDLVMPLAMKLARPEKSAWQYQHHIDWNTPVTVSDPSLSSVDITR
jgi:2-polyprenyl-6-methoxyphenol hydroxylase-like FAD-dependent oxidoreductase